MDHSFVRILGIAPYDGMKTSLIHILEEFPHIQMDVFTGDLENGVSLVQQYSDVGYDAIISRGGTAEMIRQITNIPVVPIQLSVYDVLRAIKLAETYSHLYAIVGFPSNTEPAHILCDLLEFKVNIHTVHNVQEVRNVLSSLAAQNIRTVICDMVTHTIAREMGFNAFLITSGTESIREAIHQAYQQATAYRHLRHENLFLRSLVKPGDGYTVVLSDDGTLRFCSPDTIPNEVIDSLREHLHEIPQHTPLRFYRRAKKALHIVNAHKTVVDGATINVFHDSPTQIPLRSGKLGIRALNKAECDHLFMNSIYSISGAIGELETNLKALANTNQAVMIVGELGTGKEQIARAIYLHSYRTSNPFIVSDCALMDDKSWDYFFRHPNSPMNESSYTIYFQHIEDMPNLRQKELLSLILDTNLTKRIKLLFSCDYQDGLPPPHVAQIILSNIGCATLHLQPLRKRIDEIPSLASLYLSSLNMELGKQITGFEPNAMDMLVRYEWPNNFTQFKQVLYELATLTTAHYIRASTVAETLEKERTLRRHVQTAQTGVPIAGRTLDEITYEIIIRTVEFCNGNQSVAAQQLGISRTTLWRYLKR